MFYIDVDVTRMTSLPRLELVLLAVSTIILSLPVVVHYEVVASTLEAQIAAYLLTSVNVDANRHQCNPNGGSDYSTIDLQTNPSNGNRPNSHCIPTFNILLSQNNLTLIQGSSRSLSVSLSTTSELSPPITLSAESVPAGVEFLFAPSSGRSSFSSLVTIVASAQAALGLSEVAVVARVMGIEKSATVSVLVIPEIHNLVIISGFAPLNATVGSVVVVNVTVANYGSVSEIFDLREHANVTMVAEQNHLLLAPLARYTTSLSWNTTGFSEGVYSIVVNVCPAPGEISLSDENFNVGQLSLGPRPTAQPSPRPAASGEGPSGLSYGRELAIMAALGEVIAVLLVLVRRRSRISKK